MAFGLVEWRKCNLYSRDGLTWENGFIFFPQGKNHQAENYL